jgi:RNA-directed DNA polymerase
MISPGVLDSSRLSKNTRVRDRVIKKKDTNVLLEQWKKIGTKHDNFVKLGINNITAWKYAGTRKSYWHTANSSVLSRTFTNKYLKKIGFVSISERYSLAH